MTDVVLINPLDEGHITNGLGIKVPPLNLMYLAAALEDTSESVKIIDDDLYHMGFDNVACLISKDNPKVVGITATTSTIKNALEYIKAVKKKLPNTLTVIGGPHPTFMPIETLQGEKSLDVVVTGEGEETIAEIAEKYTNGELKNFNEIKGIAYKYNDKIKLNPKRELIQDLDSISFPARHLVPFKEYKTSESQAGGMITSRGCVFSCNYCSSSLIMGKRFRTRSPENVVDEIEELSETYNVKNLALLDDIFMLNKKRADAIADEILKRGLDIHFVASTRVNTVERELLKSLKKSGMSTLYCGVESGSQRVLDLMGKGITLKHAEDAIKATKDVEVDVLASFMIGYPGETEEDINKTIDFSIKLDPDFTQYSILTPFPGTPIYYELKEKGLLATEDWNKYTALDPVIKYEKLGLSNELIKKKLNLAYLKFYTRPKYILKHRYMLGVLIKTLFKSYVLPKFERKRPDGWYNSIQEN